MVKPLNFVTRLSQPVIDNMQASVTISIVLLLGISPVLPRDILIAIVTAILLLTVVGWFKRWVLVPHLASSALLASHWLCFVCRLNFALRSASRLTQRRLNFREDHGVRVKFLDDV